MPTVFFAASPDELAMVAATHGDTTAMLAALDTVPAGDLDPAQLIDLDLLVTGNDPAEVREAVLTPAHEGPDEVGDAEGGGDAGNAGNAGDVGDVGDRGDMGGVVLLPVRPALGSRLAHLSDHDVDALAESWAAADGAADGGWDAYRRGQLIRSLSLLALLAGADRRGLFVRFDS